MRPHVRLERARTRVRLAADATHVGLFDAALRRLCVGSTGEVWTGAEAERQAAGTPTVN